MFTAEKGNKQIRIEKLVESFTPVKLEACGTPGRTPFVKLYPLPTSWIENKKSLSDSF